MALRGKTEDRAEANRENAHRAPGWKPVDPFADVPSAAQVEHVLEEIPEHALIDKAEVVILALPAGECLINQVAVYFDRVEQAFGCARRRLRSV